MSDRYIANLTPAQQKRVLNTARAFALGRKELPPLRCRRCRSPHLDRLDVDLLRCAACDTITDDATAHRLRRQEIADLLRSIAER